MVQSFEGCYIIKVRYLGERKLSQGQKSFNKGTERQERCHRFSLLFLRGHFV